ncbi:MAG: hypothetical protein QXS38_00520 [Candidatus Pacearchaeota archaeon]
MNNKAVSNIEFILSFIMFVGFVAAALYFFNPTKDVRAIQFSRDYVANEIIRNSTVELDSYSIVIKSGGANFKVYIPGIDSKMKVRVEDYNGKELPAKRIGDSICFERDGADFVTIYFSEDFEEQEFDCSGAGEGDYRMASYINGQAISEKRIGYLKDYYDDNYKSLKDIFKIPNNADFDFALEFADGRIIKAEKQIPLRVEVFSESELREVIREDGAREFAYLTVRVW